MGIELGELTSLSSIMFVLLLEPPAQIRTKHLGLHSPSLIYQPFKFASALQDINESISISKECFLMVIQDRRRAGAVGKAPQVSRDQSGTVDQHPEVDKCDLA